MKNICSDSEKYSSGQAAEDFGQASGSCQRISGSCRKLAAEVSIQMGPHLPLNLKSEA